MTGNGLLGIEGGVTASASFYYSSMPESLGLNNLIGTEIGLQADAFSVAGSGFYGFTSEFRNPFDFSNGGFSLRSPINTKEVYSGFSIGITGGILPASGSGYLGYSDYIYTSTKGWFPSLKE